MDALSQSLHNLFPCDSNYYEKFNNDTLKSVIKVIESSYLKSQAVWNRILLSIKLRVNLTTADRIVEYYINLATSISINESKMSKLTKTQSDLQFLKNKNITQVNKNNIDEFDKIIQNRAGTFVQTRIRAFLAKKQVQSLRLKQKAIVLQTSIRCYLAQEQYKTKKENAIKIQRFWKTCLDKKRFQAQKNAAIIIQKCIRNRLLPKIKKKAEATTRIQTAFRGYLARKQKQELYAKKLPTYVYYDQLRTSTKPIDKGYGEYAVFQKFAIGKSVSQENFEKAYQVIQEFNVDNIKNLENRSLAIKEAIQKIDASLDITFIPRTLYELIFIKAAIEEEIMDKENCSLKDREGYDCFLKSIKENSEKTESDENAKHLMINKKLESCWHICKFDNEQFKDNKNELVKKLAFRLNNLAVETLRPSGYFTGKEIHRIADQHIEYFKDYRKIFKDKIYPTLKEYCGSRGLAYNFGGFKSNGCGLTSFPMGLQTDKHAQVVRNAIGLECSERAHNAFILYRGGDFKNDQSLTEESLKSKSLSYGTSLFAGSMRDGTATVFYYTVKGKRDTYAIIIPFDKFKEAPLYIPNVNAISQLSGTGEFFHGRSKIPIESWDQEYILGLYMPKEKDRPEFLKSHLKADQFVKDLVEYQSKALLLGSSVYNRDGSGKGSELK